MPIETMILEDVTFFKKGVDKDPSKISSNPQLECSVGSPPCNPEDSCSPLTDPDSKDEAVYTRCNVNKFTAGNK